MRTKRIKYFDEDEKAWTVADVIVERQAEPATDCAWR